MLIWRIARHCGFDGTHTAETADPVEFIKEFRAKFGHLDWVEVFGERRPRSAVRNTIALRERALDATQTP